MKKFPQQHQDFSAYRYCLPQLQKYVATATVLAYAAIAAAVGGTVVAVQGQREAGRTAAATANYNAKLDENAAIQSEMDSREEVRRKRAENKRIISAQAGGFAAAGIDTSTGSPLEVLGQQAGLLELDALELGRQRRLQATQLRSQAFSTRLSGQSALSASRTQATGTLLSGFASAAGAYGSGVQSGAIKS